MSVSIRLFWLEAAQSLPTSADVSSNLLLRLHNWLQELDIDLVGVMRSESSDCRIAEIAIDIQQQWSNLVQASSM